MSAVVLSQPASTSGSPTTVNSIADNGSTTLLITTAASHNAVIGQVITLAGTAGAYDSGSTSASYNGRFTVITVPTSTTFTVAGVYTATSTGTCAHAGNMTTMVAPVALISGPTTNSMFTFETADDAEPHVATLLSHAGYIAIFTKVGDSTGSAANASETLATATPLRTIGSSVTLSAMPTSAAASNAVSLTDNSNTLDFLESNTFGSYSESYTPVFVFTRPVDADTPAVANLTHANTILAIASA